LTSLRGALAPKQSSSFVASGLLRFARNDGETRKFSRRVFCARGLLLVSLLRKSEGQGKPDASCTRSLVRKGSFKSARAFFTTGLADIRLSLHSGLYGLCRGSPEACKLTASVTSRAPCGSSWGTMTFPSRSLTPPESGHPRFCRSPLRSAVITPVAFPARGTCDPPAPGTVPFGVPDAESVRHPPARDSDDAFAPLWPD
jgi:hypothetical protein